MLAALTASAKMKPMFIPGSAAVDSCVTDRGTLPNDLNMKQIRTSLNAARAMYAEQEFRSSPPQGAWRLLAPCRRDAAPTMSSARTTQIASSMSPWTSASFRRALSICSQTWCV